MVKLIKGTLGNIQEYILVKRIDSRKVNLSEKAENIYNESDIQLYQEYGFNDKIYLAEMDKCIIAEGLQDIEDYLLALADDTE